MICIPELQVPVVCMEVVCILVIWVQRWAWIYKEWHTVFLHAGNDQFQHKIIIIMIYATLSHLQWCNVKNAHLIFRWRRQLYLVVLLWAFLTSDLWPLHYLHIIQVHLIYQYFYIRHSHVHLVHSQTSNTILQGADEPKRLINSNWITLFSCRPQSGWTVTPVRSVSSHSSGTSNKCGIVRRLACDR